MAKLILPIGITPLNEFELDKDTVTIGRKPVNDIQIKNAAASGTHARIITILNDSFLEDLNSTNGTLVNGNPITKHALQNGDIISIGQDKITYLNNNVSSDDDFDKTMIINPSNAAPIIAPPPKAPVKNILSAKLKLLNGAKAGQEITIKKALMTLGKPGEHVAAITRRSTGYFLLQIDSGTNTPSPRPILNGMVTTSVSTPLKNHDVIEVIGVKMEFTLS